MIPAVDRFCGFIVGQCLGDALGFPVEGEPPHACADYAGELLRSARPPERNREGFAFGQYSDQSQMARELMESYVVCGGFNAEDYAKRIAALFTEDRVVGRGRTTEAAALRLAAGIPWQQAATPPPWAGNASAMRAGMLGLLHGDDPDALIHLAGEQGRITHGDPRCAAGAVAIAGAIALASRDARPDAESFVAPLVHWCQRVEPSLASGLRRLAELRSAPKDHVVETISRIGLPPGVDSQWRGGISAFVVSSVLWALYAFLKHPDDFIPAAALAIEAGGDVDAPAAIAGALVGARRGLSALPQDLAGQLNDRGNWRLADLLELARACHEVATSTLSS